MDIENKSDNAPSEYNKIFYLILGGFIISLIFIVFFLHANTNKNNFKAIKHKTETAASTPKTAN